jgi:hypothetical protein
MKKGLLLIPPLLQLMILLAVVLAVLSPVAPLYQPITERDQGVYLYTGQQILDGGIPYRDVWDHKGPLIYYIYALGLWITHSAWGVWFVEALFLFLAGVSGFLAMRMVFAPAIAFFTTILWLAALPQVLDHGGTVEEFSLPFQFAAIYFFLRSEKKINGYWNELIVGITAALAFSLRPNNIGVHTAIGLVLLFTALFSPGERARSLKRITAAAVGSAVVFSLIAIYFAINRSLGYLLDSVFIFNYYYSRLDAFSWQALTKGYERMPLLVSLGAAGLAGLILYLYGNWKQKEKEPCIMIQLAFLTLAVVPIQLYLSLMSGRKYLHYYIAWLPVLALLAGFLIFLAVQLAGKAFPDIRHKNLPGILVAGALILAFGVKPVINRMPYLIDMGRTIWSGRTLPPPDYSADAQGVYVEYILNHTRPGDYVLIWGNESIYNFITRRESPSRFVYTYPFGVPGYVSQEMADELKFNIAQKKPMIIDATAEDKTISRIASEAWNDMPVTRGLIRFIEENYVRKDIVGPGHFRIWVYKGD